MPNSQGLNVVLVVFDTLRKDAVGSYEESPPWGAEFPPVATPNLDEFGAEAVRFSQAYPEVLPTLPARRSLYTGQRTYPFHNGHFRLKGDFVPAPGWGPIPEEQDTLAEILGDAGFRTALISDLYHQFKPSKNFWRGFDQWEFIRGQETDAARSGPVPTEEELDHWVPREFRGLRFSSDKTYGKYRVSPTEWFSRSILLNMRDRVADDQWFNAKVMSSAARWLEQNADARDRGDRIFLTVECFDPHEPWFVPAHYRRAYDPSDGREQVISLYTELPDIDQELLLRTRANYAGLVTMVDRSFGTLMAALRNGGWLDDTLVIVASDHGHSLHERRGYIGKRGYPADPEVFDIPMLMRHPQGTGAGTTCDAWVQYHDVAATILDAAGVQPRAPIDGDSFWAQAFDGASSSNDRVVIGWGSAVTVVDDRWWFNCKVDGKGALLYERDPQTRTVAEVNVADDHPDVVRSLFDAALAEAKGGIPEYLLEQAAQAEDAPGCSPFAAIPLRQEPAAGAGA